MMIITPIALDVPLRTDEDGAIRIGDTRVLLEVVIAAHLRGDTPEQIVEGYDTLKLDDVYAVIAYYLRHSDDVDAYMRQVESEGDAIRQKFAVRDHTPLTREVLLSRLKAQHDPE